MIYLVFFLIISSFINTFGMMQSLSTCRLPLLVQPCHMLLRHAVMRTPYYVSSHEVAKAQAQRGRIFEKNTNTLNTVLNCFVNIQSVINLQKHQHRSYSSQATILAKLYKEKLRIAHGSRATNMIQLHSTIPSKAMN